MSGAQLTWLRAVCAHGAALAAAGTLWAIPLGAARSPAAVPNDDGVVEATDFAKLLSGDALCAEFDEGAILASATDQVDGSTDAAAAKPSAQGTSDDPIVFATDAPLDPSLPIAVIAQQRAEGAMPSLADDYSELHKAAQDGRESVVSDDANSHSDKSAADEPTADADEEDLDARQQPQTACFHGITPGESQQADVEKAFGKSQSRSEGGASRYRVVGFPAVEVVVTDDVVEKITIELFEPASSAKLIAKLGMKGILPAGVYDAQGAVVGTVFPERGVTFNHRPTIGAALASDDGEQAAVEAGDAVFEVIVEPLSAAAFALRSESRPPRNFTERIADLEIALALDGGSADTRLKLSQLKLATGDIEDAEKLAAEAVELAPRNDACRVQWAKCLKYLAKYDQAVEQSRLVLEGSTASKLDRAAATQQMGLLAALGSKKVQERSIPLLNKAISIADPLSADENGAVAAQAGYILVQSHLAVAEQIAGGKWQKKDESVAQWISRASGLAEHMIAAGEADESLRLEVAVSALSAGAKLTPPLSPTLWVKEAEQAVADLTGEDLELPARDQLNWQLGLAYFYAAEISHRRSETDAALKFGQLAEATLVPAADARRDLPDTEYVLGRLYFQIGALHAVHFQDHETACQWYDRAAESLMKPVPLTAQTSPAQHGDALVSMGVSYWQIGQRDRAYEMTKAGVQLVEQGVQEGLLVAESLEVPRNNLASMDRVLGRNAVAQTTPAKPDATGVKIAQAPKNPMRKGQAAGGENAAPQTADRRAISTDGATHRR